VPLVGVSLPKPENIMTRLPDIVGEGYVETRNESTRVVILDL
jgi:hypothetical protein